MKTTDMIADTTPYGAFHASPESPIVLCSYAELKFIEAEAKFNTGDKAGAKAAYLEGIAANMNWYGISAADQKTYTDQASVNPSGDITLQLIMEEKYMALYTQQESYTDYRRTALPALTPAVSGKTVPVRFPTAQNQRLYNAKNLPAGAT
ncbi:MAG: SusD/RagB family nutrient-binding outer membrane lipoprotein, partial [Candidatus Kapaibacterium sp.]